MTEKLQELGNLLRSRNPATDGVKLGMFMEIVQALDLDGATTADWQEWHQVCTDTNTIHGYVNRTLYQSSGGVR